jgi:hypothetical protein
MAERRALEEPPANPHTLDPRAIFLGVVTDHALTWVASRCLPAPSLGALMAVGLGSTAAGGLVAGRSAAGAPVLQGAAVGAVALAIGALSLVGPIAELPGGYLASMFSLVVPAGALGGLAARRPSSRLRRISREDAET